MVVPGRDLGLVEHRDLGGGQRGRVKRDGVDLADDFVVGGAAVCVPPDTVLPVACQGVVKAVLACSVPLTYSEIVWSARLYTPTT